MSTPLHSAYIADVHARGLVVALSPMSSDPAEAEVTPDFALQLILEAHWQTSTKPPPGGARLFDTLLEWIVTPSYKAFCDAGLYYVYYVKKVGPVELDETGRGSSLTLAIGCRLPWLVAALRPGMVWESAAYSFAGSLYS